MICIFFMQNDTPIVFWFRECSRRIRFIKITKNDSTIKLTERTNLSEVSKFFRLSSMFLHDEMIDDFRYGKEMCLIVKKDEDYVYCYLVFDDKDQFFAMHLYNIKQITD